MKKHDKTETAEDIQPSSESSGIVMSERYAMMPGQPGFIYYRQDFAMTIRYVQTLNAALRRTISAATATAMLTGIGVSGSAKAQTDGLSGAIDPARRIATASPIKHLVVIIGENQSFDHIFATYTAPSGDAVQNLLSEKIINEDGSKGPNFSLGAQSSATENDTFRLAPGTRETYAHLPPQTTGNLPVGANDTAGPPFETAAGAVAFEKKFYGSFTKLFNFADMTIGASQLPKYTPDPRIANVNALPNGPFQVTSRTTPYDFYTGDPNHGFWTEWQQGDCDISHKTDANPSGCLNDLFPWVEATRSSNGIGSGGVALGFYNVKNNDVPYFTWLASQYTISDNYHQPMRGPSSPNWNYFGTADEIYFSDGKGHPATPPASLIMNPNPQPGANNSPINDAGNFVNCSDSAQPGVATVLGYLASLPYKPNSGCAASAYYHVASRRPGYFPDGSLNTNPDALPPSPTPTIGENLSAKGVSWAWYAGGYALYKANPRDTSVVGGYCDNCNPFQFSTAVMSTAASRGEHFKDAQDLLSDIDRGTLPAVSFLRSDAAPCGHPQLSKLSSFEDYVKVFVGKIQNQPALWADTAILITFDEGGGYWDSGYIQPIDFFGDGVRVPMIVVSNYSKGGHVGHVYSDHASLVKFIEWNWGLDKLSARSRDNLPQPVMKAGGSAYVPTNPPAIGDLRDLFNFQGPSKAEGL